MVYIPPQFRTWLALRVSPFQTWSCIDITRLVQRFGYPQQIYPYSVNVGHFREIRVLVIGEHPVDIHHHIMFKEGDFSIVIDVFIHHLEAIVNNHLPPHSPLGGQVYAQDELNSPASEAGRNNTPPPPCRRHYQQGQPLRTHHGPQGRFLQPWIEKEESQMTKQIWVTKVPQISSTSMVTTWRVTQYLVTQATLTVE
jgi:hypothetical protein